MPTDPKPLFRLDALRPKLAAFALPSAAAGARPKLSNWKSLLHSKAAEKMKETELLGDFLRDVFGDVLGHVGPASGEPVYTINCESLVQADRKFAAPPWAAFPWPTPPRTTSSSSKAKAHAIRRAAPTPAANAPPSSRPCNMPSTSRLTGYHPCRLARQVKKFDGLTEAVSTPPTPAGSPGR